MPSGARCRREVPAVSQWPTSVRGRRAARARAESRRGRRCARRRRHPARSRAVARPPPRRRRRSMRAARVAHGSRRRPGEGDRRPRPQPLSQLVGSRPLRGLPEIGEQVVRERHAGFGRAGLELAMKRLGHIADLDHAGHVSSMVTCAEHVNASAGRCSPPGNRAREIGWHRTRHRTRQHHHRAMTTPCHGIGGHISPSQITRFVSIPTEYGGQTSRLPTTRP